MDNTAEEVVLVTGSQVNDDNKEQTVVRNLIASNQSGSSNLTSEQLVLLLLLQHQSLDPLRRNLDDFFLVLLAVITYGLQMGFLFVEVGLVQKKNVTSILFKSTLDGYVGCVSFWLVGYALAW
uniref:Ammonium transporter AmtB-like domain-containing protein n=1 Tax=Daphnia galeata TaxID=27404 RepID=A0A8J2RAZ1_9CRUS|nr:unnamed protein product [Daphnia galeata]